VPARKPSRQEKSKRLAHEPPNDFPAWRVYLSVSVPSTVSATVEALQSPTSTDRLARLFDAHHDRLFRLARRLSSDREEARDLVQETFLRAARRPAAVPEGSRPEEAWLVRTLVNLCRDRHRRLAVRSRERERLVQEAGTPHPEAAAVARTAVRAALGRLSPRRRAVIVLHELEGTPVREIARLLAVSEVTVRWHLLAARRELASVLSAKEIQEDRR
jgi:RNA polymerase sigma-70 factor (ECF subfamily)